MLLPDDAVVQIARSCFSITTEELRRPLLLRKLAETVLLDLAR